MVQPKVVNGVFLATRRDIPHWPILQRIQLSEASTKSGEYRYRYDVTGNRTLHSAQTTLEEHQSTLTYPAVGEGNQLKSRTDHASGEQDIYRYNEAGSPLVMGELSYTYNADQRPVEVRRDGKLIAQYCCAPRSNHTLSQIIRHNVWHFLPPIPTLTS